MRSDHSEEIDDMFRRMTGKAEAAEAIGALMGLLLPAYRAAIADGATAGEAVAVTSALATALVYGGAKGAGDA